RSWSADACRTASPFASAFILCRHFVKQVMQNELLSEQRQPQGKGRSYALRHVRSLLCLALFFMERLCVLTLPLWRDGTDSVGRFDLQHQRLTQSEIVVRCIRPEVGYLQILPQDNGSDIGSD